MPSMTSNGLMFFQRMCSLVLLEVGFPRVGFRTIRDGTMVLFPCVFGALAVAIEVAFPLCFVEAFAAINSGSIGTELNERRIASTSYRRSGSRGVLSSGTRHMQGRAHLHKRRGCIVWVSDVCVQRRRHRRGGGKLSYDHWCSAFVARGQVAIVFLSVLIDLTAK